MEVQVAVLCDAAADYGGKLSILGSFDTLLVRQFPATHPQCSLALRLTLYEEDSGRHELRIVLIDEDGRNVIQPLQSTIEFRLPEQQFFCTQNLIFNLQGLRFERAGQYSFDILIDSEILSRVPLQALQLPAGEAL